MNIDEDKENEKFCKTKNSTYDFIEEIGSGTYGVVYRALNRSSNEVLAVKKIKTVLISEGIPSTALREITLLKELDHPSIIKLKDVTVFQNKLYMVFDFVEKDLKKYFDEMKYEKINLVMIKSFLFQLLNGIAYCHSKRIIHRDLKPQNILINSQFQLKIADFGLSRIFSIPVRPFTKEVLTLWYRSPEILLGSQEYSTAIDVWSAGCIFAEMIINKTLFQGDSDIDQLFRIFKVLGTPNNNMWEGVENLPYYKKTYPKWNPVNFNEYFNGFDVEGLDLLRRMLSYDPNLRISAKQALKHGFFNGVECPELINYLKENTII